MIFHRKSILGFVFCFFGGFFLLHTPAQSQGAQYRPLVAVPLISQLVQKNQAGQWQGALIDVLKKVEQKSSLEFDYKVVPFKRAVMMTKKGVSDFGVFLESPERNQMALPIVKLGESLYVAVSLKSNKVSSLHQLSGKVLGRIRGGSELKSLKVLPSLKYHYFNTHEEGLKLLTHGRIDVLITTDFRILEAVERLHLSYDDIARPVPIEGRGLWLYWSWKSAMDFNEVRKIKDGPGFMIEGFMPRQLFDIYKSQLETKTQK